MAIPERGNLIWADPAELMRDNPAALIVNRESYGRMDAFFDPGLMQFPIGTRVSTFSASGEQVVKIFITDGMTRTKFANDQKTLGHNTFEDYAKAKRIDLEQFLKEYREFRFDRLQIKDATTSYLRNPSVVPTSERREGQDALTIVQYLRAVIPPTVEHAQIAPDRIAAHLVNGWENMVGPDTAKKFTALAALSFLSDRKVPIATEHLLKQHLARQEKLVADETPEERSKLEKHLLEIGSVIRESKIIAGNIKIAQAAFVLVSSGSEIIGGEKEARKQVYGLLYTPQLERKLEEYPQGERTEKRLKLGELIYATLNRVGQEQSGIEQITTAIDNILRDPRLDYATTDRILASSDIAREYTVVQQEINAGKLGDYYLFTTRKEELTPAEATLIDRLGKKTYLQDSEIAGLGRAIHEAEAAIQQINALTVDLENQSVQLQDRGVKIATIDEVISNLSSARSSLFEADSRNTLSRRSRELKEAITASQARIEKEIRLYTIGKIVGEVFGEARPEVAYYTLRENLVQETEVRHVAEQLKTLDLDLQARVLNGEIRLARALQQHDDRRKALVRPAIETVPAVTPLNVPVKETRPAAPVEGPISQLVEMDKKTIEEGRVKLNSERLKQAAVNFRDLLKSLDLERDEISKEALAALDSVLVEVGKLRFEHPNMVRVMEDYPQLLKQIQGLREAKLHQEQVDLTKDTQTQI